MSTADYLAEGSNSLIEEPNETLLRQVHPDHLLEDGTLTKQAFNPSVGHDNLLLSTKRERFGALEACAAHRAIPLQSAGTWGVEVGVATDLELPCVDDAEHVHVVDHASISFLDHGSPGQRAQRARKLKDAAVCLYRPADLEPAESAG